MAKGTYGAWLSRPSIKGVALQGHFWAKRNPISANWTAGVPTLPWLVWVDGSQLQGFCCAGKWKGRGAYRYSVESTIYLRRESIGRGIGTQLYRALLDDLHQKALHVVIAGIALPNQASVAFHEKLGFHKVARFEQVGWKFNQWIDVGYWQLILDQAMEQMPARERV